MPASEEESGPAVGVSRLVEVSESDPVVVSAAVELSPAGAVVVALPESMVVWMEGAVVGTRVGGSSVSGGAVAVAVYKLVLYSIVPV